MGYSLSMEKACSKCRESKPLDQFNRRAKSPDGHQPMCRVCQAAKDKANYEKKKSSDYDYSERKSHKLTPEQKIQAIAWREEGIPAAEIARRLNISKQSISYLLKSQGIPTTDIDFFHPIQEQIDQMIHLRKQGKTFEKIAQEMNLKPKQVEYQLLKVGITLTPEQISDIRRIHSRDLDTQAIQMRNEGVSIQEISNQLGTTKHYVKKLMYKEGVTIPLEQRERNAQAELANKHPNHMQEIRNCITPTIVKKRNQSIRDTYQSTHLREQASARAINWWHSLNNEDKEAYLNKRRKSLETSQKTKRYWERNLEGRTFQETLEDIVKDKRGKIITDYTSSKTKATFECKKGHRFDAIPNSIMASNSWCPRCAHTGPSRGQLEVYEYIKHLLPNEEILVSDRKAIAPLELDVYVPARRFGLEYNGLLWHSNYHQDMRGRHCRKAMACRDAGINLLAIFEDEWSNKQNLIKAMIAQRLGMSTAVKLNARSLEVRRLEKNAEFEDFFDEYHLDGHTNASYAYALFHENQMVSCASFRVNFNGELEIARFASDYHYRVRGAAGKLLSNIREPLITFSNNRIGNGAVYEKTGFKLLKENPPSYWYTDGFIRIWRFKCRRINNPAVLIDYPTEESQCLAGFQSEPIFGDDRPLYRVEDYGHRKWSRVPG